MAIIKGAGLIRKYVSTRNKHSSNGNGKYVLQLAPNYRGGIDFIVFTNDDDCHAVGLYSTFLSEDLQPDDKLDILIKHIDVYVERVVSKMTEGQSIDFKMLAEILTDKYCNEVYEKKMKEQEVNSNLEMQGATINES